MIICRYCKGEIRKGQKLYQRVIPDGDGNIWNCNVKASGSHHRPYSFSTYFNLFDKL